MWNGHSVGVILPTYNEKDSIRKCILDFQATGVIDEVLVVNNNAAEGTSAEVAGTGAREVFESRQGYGQAIRRGLQDATSDWLVVCEPDGTFRPSDVLKLLAYAEDFGYVIGTRTTREMIWKGANMGLFLKWGNWAVGKMAEFLFNGTILTDVGCTFRLIKRDVLDDIAPHFTQTKNTFGLEMTLLVMRRRIPFVEIPVNYMERVGRSSVTGDMRKTFVLGMKMIMLILRYRFSGPPRRPAK